MDIVEFLTVRLDEDEQAAREASVFYDDHNAYENGVAWRGHEGENANGYMNFWLVPHLGVINDPASGRHIVRHNPKRVLAEAKAKRAIVALHAPIEIDCSDVAGDPWSGTACYACEGGEGWPCTTLRYLTAPYADHPDYASSWSVS